jgi:hypothetical protein
MTERMIPCRAALARCALRSGKMNLGEALSFQTRFSVDAASSNHPRLLRKTRTTPGVDPLEVAVRCRLRLRMTTTMTDQTA